MKQKKLLTMLVLLLMAATGAYATEFTSLKVGDVLHVGDVINTGTNYRVGITDLDANFQPATLVRGNIGTMVITESETGAYYLIKDKKGVYFGVIEGEGYEGGNWPVTDTSDGISVTAITPGDYGYTELTFAVHEGPATYKITLAEGTEDAENWKVKVGEGEAKAFPVEGLKGGEDVTVKYNGSREVKSVTVVKVAKGGAVDNAYLKWDADQKKLVATPMPESFTTVTSETGEWSAGTYVVEGEVDINGTIVLAGDVNLIIKDGAKLDVYHLYGNSHNLSIYGQAQMTGELVVNNSGGDAINEIPTLEVHSAKVTATSSSDYGAGFYEIYEFNVYGGLVDAKGTAENGGTGISLKENGSINIYGGEVKAEGKGNDPNNYGITSSASIISDAASVRVYGGKLWAGCANNQALNNDGTILRKDNGYSGKIETSADNQSWTQYNGESTPDTKYVRVGY